MKPTRTVAGTRPRRDSATDDAYHSIKRRILICDLGPGAELREVSLAEGTGFGRSPVREALRRLVQEGFVEVRPRQGYRVSAITLATVHDVFELRLLLEPAAVALAARQAPQERLLDLRGLAHARYRHGDVEGYEKFVLDNREFHVGIAEAAGNDRLAKLLRSVLEEMQRLFFLSIDADDTGSEQMLEHHALYDALLAGDAERARGIVVAQIEESRRRVVEVLVGRILDGRGAAAAGRDVKLSLDQHDPSTRRRLRQDGRIRTRSTPRADPAPARRMAVRGRSYL